MVYLLELSLSHSLLINILYENFAFSLYRYVYNRSMPRQSRIDVADRYYHCINRSNARLKINYAREDLVLFMRVLFDAQEIFGTNIIAFVVMNNHFHLVIKTRYDKEMSLFMRWLTFVHTQRWHKLHDTLGTGHLYQGRYKSFVIKDQKHLETVIRYVERNPLTAGFVENVLDWKYSSLYQRRVNSKEGVQIELTKWPHEEPLDYLDNLIKPFSNKEIAKSLETEME
jgi:putative transposase